MKNSEKPAYPLHHDSTIHNENGLTKREYFAGLAMQGFCSIPNADITPEEFANYSVLLADALLKQLEK